MQNKQSRAANLARTLGNIHRQGSRPNIFVFATPRSGSTWLMEFLNQQAGTKACSELFNFRREGVKSYFKTEDWGILYENPMNPLVERYIEDIYAGKSSVGFLNIFPFRHKYYRVLSDRIVFKVLHGMEDRINWIKDTFEAKVILLLRHPIAVSLSRETFPRLDIFLNSDYSRNFTPEQLKYGRHILENGSKMEKGMLSWCLQNAVPLREANEDWVVVSFEQLNTEAARLIPILNEKLDLDTGNIDELLDQLNRPSSSSSKSDKETQQKLKESDPNDKTWLIEKWRSKVSVEEEQKLMEVLELFEIDYYEAGSFVPNKKYWL
ncbi:MAG: sulfotransferase [Bacteroidota bacterium]